MRKLLVMLLALGMLLADAFALTLPEDIIDPPAGFDQRQEGVAYGQMRYKTYLSKTTGSFRDVMVLLPPDYSAETAYPVLYLLHGIGGDENEWASGKPDVVIGNLIAAGEAPPMIVVMPNIRARKNDAPNSADMYSPEHFAAFDNFINDLRDDLMPFIEKEYLIAKGPENTAIAGLSMGGREALYIGLSMQETFGYIGAFCPAPGLLPYHAEKGLFQVEDFTDAAGTMPYVLINAGVNDFVVGDWPQTYSETLGDNGTIHTFYTTLGGHDFNVWKHGLYNFARNIF